MKIFLTVIVTAAATWIIALIYRDEQFAGLIWAECPHVVDTRNPEVWYIQLGDGFIPVRPRRPNEMTPVSAP
jgi:hypothetical protein